MASIHPRHQSEVAALRERIEQEYQAACRALTGLADGTARHDFIAHRYNRIGDYQEQLAAIVGEKASMNIVVEVIEKSPEQRGETHE